MLNVINAIEGNGGKFLWTEDIASDVPILTDNFAPVDHYISKAF
ncbi:MAG: hypothetical protein O3A80_01975 [bacterium]|nr:hypothetical protein [bacterium]MDA1292176.1 hypothetical protein [bacterium]